MDTHLTASIIMEERWEVSDPREVAKCQVLARGPIRR